MNASAAKKYAALPACAVPFAALAGIVPEKCPLFQIRLRAPHTASDAQWAATFRALSGNRGACDEVWFSTGITFPRMEWHREHAARLARYAEDLRRAGIVPSLQFQATLGHGDSFTCPPEEMAGRTWGGFTGPSGVECERCNCPRQPALVAYVREMARIYAEAFRPAWVWIDDDLRIYNHSPAVGEGDIGCWCDTCLGFFNRKTGGAWTRESLAEAIGRDAALFDSWERFSFESISVVARAIAEEVTAASPGTRLGYQHGPWPPPSAVRPDGGKSSRMQLAVFEALREGCGGRQVGSRSGMGIWHDIDPNGPVMKAFVAARQRRILGDPPWIDTWIPEIETWPRGFASRTARSILLESIGSLAAGMDGLSVFIMDTNSETDVWYAENLLAPVAAERDLFDRYREACAGTLPAGLDVPADLPRKGVYRYALAGIPVVPGPGIHMGSMTAEDATVKIANLTSRDILRMRSEADARAGGRLPVVVEDPTVGLVVPRTTPEGELRSVLMVNCRIDLQKPVSLRLRGVPDGTLRAVWRAFGEAPATLPIRRDGKDALVAVPALSAWNAGWLGFERDLEDGGPAFADVSSSSQNSGNPGLPRAILPGPGPAAEQPKIDETNLLGRAWATLENNIVTGEGVQWNPLRGIVPSAGHFYGVWNWDSAFHALAAVRRDPELARDQFRIMMKWQGEDGMYADVVKQDPEKGVFRGCTKPPVWAWAVWTIDRAEPDDAFLREAYASLVREEAFWRVKRMDIGLGMFHYDGNSTNRNERMEYAGWESGWDNSPRWDGNAPAVIPVDLNCWMVLRYRAMREIAKHLGLETDSARWAKDAEDLAAKVESLFWDAENGCYYDWDSEKKSFKRVLTPASFMPLFIGTASAGRAAAMAGQAKRLSPGWPSVEYAHPEFRPTKYWRGRTWLNIAYFALKGLKYYGHDEIADAGRATLLSWVDRNREAICENYNPVTGDVVGCPSFGWSAVFTIKFINDWDMPRAVETPVKGIDR